MSDAKNGHDKEQESIIIEEQKEDGFVFDYYEKKKLLSSAEYYFWLPLKNKCDENNFIICPKVRLEDFINVSNNDFKIRQKYRGFIKSRHIDFLICDSKLNILAGIELDDSSHKQENVKKTDSFKNNVFKQVGIPLFRIKVDSKKYNDELDAIIKQLK